MFDSFIRKLINAAARGVSGNDWTAEKVNRLIINSLVNKVRTRPHPWSTVSDYTSWRSLTDKTWSARHLPARKEPDDLPPIENLLDLFRRPDGQQKLSDKSTCLFPTFAQFLTDGFLRTVPAKDEQDEISLRRNTSTHNIDLCQLYGRTQEQTLILRLQSEGQGQKGRLKSQMIDGEEYAPFLYKDEALDPQFEGIDPPLGLGSIQGPEHAEHRAKLFAFGGDRSNSAPQVSMLTTLLLREHNRLAGELEERNPGWDDDRVFETARNILIVLFIKLVVEEYINHIASKPFRLRADPSVAWNAPWNKPIWMTSEFSLLYRWHSLIPDIITWNGTRIPVGMTFLNNSAFLDGGMRQGFLDMSAQAAGALGPRNTTDALLHVEAKSIRQGRACDLDTYVRYRAYCGLPAPQKFEDISSDPEVVRVLKANYASVADIEFYVGLFAEDRIINSPLSELVNTMVAVDAFSQALTNPLLSQHVFNKQTFSEYGWQLINQPVSIKALVERNSPGGPISGFIGMTQLDWDFI